VLQPGEILNMENLAESLGATRTPLREALIQLESEGLIEFSPQRWTRVTSLSVAELESFYPVWVELQVIAVRFAVERGCPNLADIEAAQVDFVALVDQAMRSPGKEEQKLVYQADAHFHDEILRGTENDYLTHALAPLSSLAQRYDFCYFGAMQMIGHESVADHEQILDGLRRGDADSAAEVMRINAARTLDLVRGGFPGLIW
jgi:DNA-binding GntR family transcriptional regulator